MLAESMIPFKRMIVFFALGLAIFPFAAMAQEAGRWSFDPARDDFSPDAILDLRSLNEKVAGQSGFVRVAPNGQGFVLGDGTPARFWAANTGVNGADALARHAKFLAKRGVNMVRWHGDMVPREPNAQLTDFNRDSRERCWALVAAMKQEGIYSTISPYWANTLNIPAAWGVPGPDKQNAQGLLFYDPTLQQGYKAWLKALLAEKNPHTGIPLAQDPAVAIIQLQNEDSMLFWTIQNISPDQRKELGKMFGDWLKKKYGSLDKAVEAWSGDKIKDDDLDKGIVGIYIIWELTQHREGGKAVRLADQLQFFGETMRAFNVEIARYLRDDLGCKQLINDGNWRTADTVKLNDVERWTYTAGDVVAANKYFDGVHLGEKRGWAIDVGDQFTNVTCLLDPRSLPINLKQVAGYPTIVSESSWVPPIGYQSEGPFLIAAYESLTGVDAYYWFATGVTDWWQPSSANGYTTAIGKWVMATPELMGEFPAAALAYRRGYIQRGKPAVFEQRGLEDLWQRRSPIIAEEKSYDPNRDSGDIAEKSNVKNGVNPLAFLVGPVMAKYGGDPAKSQVVDLSQYIDESKKTIKSVTGEIFMDYGVGLCTINASKVQGASGFLAKAGAIKLDDVEITSGNAYATIMVVSMDDKPLKSSGKILIQVGTQSRPTGWQDKAAKFKGEGGKETFDGFEVVSLGKPPWSVISADATITLKTAVVKKGTILDMNGMPVGDLAVDTTHGGAIVKLPTNAMYVVLQ